MTPGAWLVGIDLQHVFGDPASPWASAQYPRAVEGTRALLPAFAGRTVLTRFVAPAVPTGAWVPYYADWPFALVPDSDPLYALAPELASLDVPVVTETTFGKWGPALARAVQGRRGPRAHRRLDRLLRALDGARRRRCRGGRTGGDRRVRWSERRRPPAGARGDGALRTADHPDHGGRGARVSGRGVLVTGSSRGVGAAAARAFAARGDRVVVHA